MRLLQPRGQEMTFHGHDNLKLLVVGLLNQTRKRILMFASCVSEFMQWNEFLGLSSFCCETTYRDFLIFWWGPGNILNSSDFAVGLHLFSCLMNHMNLAVLQHWLQGCKSYLNSWTGIGNLSFCIPHLCSCCVGHLSAGLSISAHLAVSSQNNLMDTQVLCIYLS